MIIVGRRGRAVLGIWGLNGARGVQGFRFYLDPKSS